MKLINWVKNSFKYEPKFKAGDVVINNIEGWEDELSEKYKILAVGKNNYLVQPSWAYHDDKYFNNKAYNYSYSFWFIDIFFRIHNER